MTFCLTFSGENAYLIYFCKVACPWDSQNFDARWNKNIERFRNLFVVTSGIIVFFLQEYLRKIVNKAFPRRFNYLKIIIMMKIEINTWKALHIVPCYYKNAKFFYQSQNWFTYKATARNDSEISSWYFGYRVGVGVTSTFFFDTNTRTSTHLRINWKLLSSWASFLELSRMKEKTVFYSVSLFFFSSLILYIFTSYIETNIARKKEWEAVLIVF